MKKFKNYTLKEYSDVLSQKTPIPGGGSAVALSAALGAGLISMVANYSKGKSHDARIEKEIQKILNKSEKLRKRFLDLVDLDAQAYMKVVKARNKGEQAKRKAQAQSQKVPLEICRLCYGAVQLTPFLVSKGNKYLVSDVEVAVELLLSAFNASLAFLKE